MKRTLRLRAFIFDDKRTGFNHILTGGSTRSNTILCDPAAVIVVLNLLFAWQITEGCPLAL